MSSPHIARSPLSPNLSLGDRFVLTFSSSLGLGYLPKAPGTWGTLLALPLWYGARHVATPSFALGVFALSLAAIFISSRAETIYGAHDVQRITIDEVAGMLVTVVGVPWSVPNVIVAFVSFRVLDATKPQPIRWVDRHVSGGLGVVLDDLLAGLVGCFFLHAYHRYFGVWFG